MLSRFYTYENEDKINIDLKCSICLDPYQSPLCNAHCGHMFCFLCLKAWLRQKQSCPICRRYFTKFIPVSDKKLLRELHDLSVQCVQCNEMNIKRGKFNDHIRYQCTKRIFIDQEESLVERLNKSTENHRRQHQQNYQDITCDSSLIWLFIVLTFHISFYFLSLIPDIIFLLITNFIIHPILYTISRLIRFIITTINSYK